jgi:hypothetical protein
MRCLLPFLAILPVAALATPLRHFDVAATFQHPKRVGGIASVAVMFRALDPDLRINESPAPRLRLDLTQTVLVDRQAPAPSDAPAYDTLTARYLDLTKPVLFPVALAPAAPKGPQTVKASVVYFYCSQREAWCRRGIADLDIEVTVP